MGGKAKYKLTKAEGFGGDSACESWLDHFPNLKDDVLVHVPQGRTQEREQIEL